MKGCYQPVAVLSDVAFTPLKLGAAARSHLGHFPASMSGQAVVSYGAPGYHRAYGGPGRKTKAQNLLVLVPNPKDRSTERLFSSNYHQWGIRDKEKHEIPAVAVRTEKPDQKQEDVEAGRHSISKLSGDGSGPSHAA